MKTIKIIFAIGLLGTSFIACTAEDLNLDTHRPTIYATGDQGSDKGDPEDVYKEQQ